MRQFFFCHLSRPGGPPNRLRRNAHSARGFLGFDDYETYELLQSSTTIILVSDGGADDSRGSTGWIVSAFTGRRLLQGSATGAAALANYNDRLFDRSRTNKLILKIHATTVR
jgi:hypothetical protein